MNVNYHCIARGMAVELARAESELAIKSWMQKDFAQRLPAWKEQFIQDIMEKDLNVDLRTAKNKCDKKAKDIASSITHSNVKTTCFTLCLLDNIGAKGQHHIRMTKLTQNIVGIAPQSVRNAVNYLDICGRVTLDKDKGGLLITVKDIMYFDRYRRDLLEKESTARKYKKIIKSLG